MDIELIKELGKTFGIQETGIIPIFEYLDSLPRGAVIATAELIDCHKIIRCGGREISSTGTGWFVTGDGAYEPSEPELLFGDWTPGRYA